MKLWLLRPLPYFLANERVEESNPWRNFYDTTHGILLRADSEARARVLAVEASGGDEDNRGWLDPALSTCVEVTSEGPEEMLIIDFCRG